MIVYGKNVFNEIKTSKNKIKKVYLSSSFQDKEIIGYIKSNNIPYQTIEKRKFEMMYKNAQGIALNINDYEYKDIKDIDLNEKFIVMLDHIEDEHNLGAMIRTCETRGIKSIIIPKDRCAQITPTVMKVSTGAIEYVNIYMVSNLSNAIKYLKNNGYFVYGAEADGTSYNKVDYADKKVLIIGSEGHGISKVIRDNCDEIISIPMQGKVNSLNASVSLGVLVYGIE